MGTSTSKSKINLSKDKIKTYLLGNIEVLDEHSEIESKLQSYCQGELCVKYDSISENVFKFVNTFINILAYNTHMRSTHLTYSESAQCEKNKSINYFHYKFREYWIESQIIPKIPHLENSAVLSFLCIYFSNQMNEDIAKKIVMLYNQIKYHKKKKSFLSYFS